MATFTLFNNFIEAMAHGAYDLENDQLVVELVNSPAPDTADVAIGDITPITYTYCSSRNVTTTSSAQTGGAYKLELADLLITASGGTVGPYTYVVLTDPTAVGNELIGFTNCGSFTLLTGEGHYIDFNQASGAITVS